MTTERSSRRLTKSMVRANLWASMISRGWYRCQVPSWLLTELGIPYESMVSDRTQLTFAPVWVHLLCPKYPGGTHWSVLQAVLGKALSDPQDTSLVVAEAVLDDRLSESVRSAARNYTALLAKVRKTTDGPTPTNSNR